jgi:hypothetical protein
MVNELGLERAVKTITHSRDTHVRWLYYLEKGGEAPKEVGDASYHSAAVDEYQNVLECLLLLQGLIDLAEGKVKPIEQIRRELRPGITDVEGYNF